MNRSLLTKAKTPVYPTADDARRIANANVKVEASRAQEIITTVDDRIMHRSRDGYYDCMGWMREDRRIHRQLQCHYEGRGYWIETVHFTHSGGGVAKAFEVHWDAKPVPWWLRLLTYACGDGSIR